jgi:RecJ-like exonuclease
MSAGSDADIFDLIAPSWRCSPVHYVGLADLAREDVDRETHVKTCPDCNGDGVIEKGTDDEQQCPTCGGSGFVPDDDDDEEVTQTASR